MPHTLKTTLWKFDLNIKTSIRRGVNPLVGFVFPTSETSSLNEPVLQEQVEKLNRQNTEHSHGKAEADNQRGEDRGRQEPAKLILDGPHASDTQSEERKKTTKGKEEAEEEEGDVSEEPESDEEGKAEDVRPEQAGKVKDDGEKTHKVEAEESSKSEAVVGDICKTSLLPQERYFNQNTCFMHVR